MNKCVFLTLAPVPGISSFLSCTATPPTTHFPEPGDTECAGLSWTSSPNCRTQMPIRSRVSYSSGLGLARGLWHPCGMWRGLRSCLWRVYHSANEQEIFSNTVTRWAGHISAKHHLPKQVHGGCGTTGECVVLAPSTDRNSKHIQLFYQQVLCRPWGWNWSSLCLVWRALVSLL